MLLPCALALVLIGAAPPEPKPYFQTYLGPTAILYMDADTVMVLRTLEWHSEAARHQDKLLHTKVRMQYWLEHIPADMRRVFDTLGYPTGRVLLTPVGHTEEHWYYGQLAPPLVFRDGVLANPDLLDEMTRR